MNSLTRKILLREVEMRHRQLKEADQRAAQLQCDLDGATAECSALQAAIAVIEADLAAPFVAEAKAAA